MNLINQEFLLVDKPAGMSSFAVVARIRRVLTEQMREDYAVREAAVLRGEMPKEVLGAKPPKRAKVGHAGTLDPFATGLLICLLGKGTKRAGEFLKKDKRYEATIRLGMVSSTGDIEGELSEYAVSEIPDISRIEAVVKSFQGEIRQRVPAYSAVKINGRRAYDLARKGVQVEMPEREVRIYDIKVVSYEWPELKIDCKVSSGTYIRALGEDIGKVLGVGGYLTALRRTEIGDFSVKDAVRLEDLGILD